MLAKSRHCGMPKDWDLFFKQPNNDILYFGMQVAGESMTVVKHAAVQDFTTGSAQVIEQQIHLVDEELLVIA